MERTTVFIPVDVNVRLPKETGKFFVCLIEGNIDSLNFDSKENCFYGWQDRVTHWLEKQENMLVLNDAELNVIESNMYQSGLSHIKGYLNPAA